MPARGHLDDRVKGLEIGGESASAFGGVELLFLGAALAGSWDERSPAAEREWATASAVALAVRNGADVLRLHDASALQAMRVAAAIERPGATVG